MSETDRRLELAFDFIGAVLKSPALLDSLPDRAVLGVGDESAPELTAESARLAHLVYTVSRLDRGMACPHVFR